MIRWTKDKIKPILQPVFDALLDSSTRPPRQASPAQVAEQTMVEKAAAQIRSDPSFPARFWPCNPGQGACLVPRHPHALETDSIDNLPVPPRDLWAGYGASAEEYVVVSEKVFLTSQDVFLFVNR
jgi:hypothetical protein